MISYHARYFLVHIQMSHISRKNELHSSGAFSHCFVMFCGSFDICIMVAYGELLIFISKTSAALCEWQMHRLIKIPFN